MADEQSSSPVVPQTHSPRAIDSGGLLGPGGSSSVSNLSSNFVSHGTRPAQVNEILDPANVPPSASGGFQPAGLTQTVSALWILNNRPVDLHALFCETVAYGGNKNATKDDAWGIIGGWMGLAQLPATPAEPLKASPDVARLLAHVYQRLFASFEVAFPEAYREQQARVQWALQ
ncbi:hypothetical protein BS47DRAFT_1357258 [Hydnum rufescens UP504]|uniref:ARID domain-containing protein n=1 Tax=Hydnum rufescens UP504 TaxID=1448309 RepID=A0A9P6BDI5_9AGAM|nr:hypothetical protein BS47DRAFT_1357258 [Hydnum rufescens UP504]